MGRQWPSLGLHASCLGGGQDEHIFLRGGLVTYVA